MPLFSQDFVLEELTTSLESHQFNGSIHDRRFPIDGGEDRMVETARLCSRQSAVTDFTALIVGSRRQAEEGSCHLIGRSESRVNTDDRHTIR